MTVNHLYPHDYRAEFLSATSATLTHAHITGAIELTDCTGHIIRSSNDSIKTVNGAFESLFAKKDIHIKGSKVTLTVEAETIQAEEAHLNEVKAKKSIHFVNTAAHTIFSKYGSITLNNSQVKEVDVVTAHTDLRLTHVKVYDHAKSLTAGITANDVEAPHLEASNTLFISNSRINLITLIVTEPNAKITSIFSTIKELVIVNPMKLPVEYQGTLPRTITRL